MSLYRFLTKAGMPSRVPSLSDKEIENANTSVKKLQEMLPASIGKYAAELQALFGTSLECARGRGYIYLYSQVSRPSNLNPPIFLFTLVWANPPNLMPAKFSGYTV